MVISAQHNDLQFVVGHEGCVSMSDDEALRGILESGKERSDRLAERGFRDDPRFPRNDYGYGHNSGDRNSSSEPSASGGWLWPLVAGFGSLAVSVLMWLIPIMAGIFWEIARAIFSRVGRHRR